MLRIQHKSTEKTILLRKKKLRIQHKSTETSIFFIATKFSKPSQLKEEIMSQQR